MSTIKASPELHFAYRNTRKQRAESPTKAPVTSKTHQGAWSGVAVLWGLEKNAKSFRPAECHVDWDAAEGSADPCLAAVKLFHVARRSVGTSRWWTMRWPQNSTSLVGRAGELSPGKTYKLMRALRKHALNYLNQLWMFASDRRHAKDVTTQTAELKADWRRVQKRLGYA